MKLILNTQDHEWYGNEEGTEGRWKPKGGIDIEVGSMRIMHGGEVERIVSSLKPIVEISNKFFCREVVSWCVINDDELTESEQLEEDYEGFVRYGRSYLHEGRVVEGGWYRQNVLKTA